MVATIWGSLSLLSNRQRFAVVVLALATLVINSLDIVAISMVGLVGTLALGEEVQIDLPWVSGNDPESLVVSILLIAAGIFFLKTVLGILVAKWRQNFLARVEVYFSRLIAADMLYSGLGKVKRHSRSQLEWAILRSTAIAFGSVLGQTLSLFAEVSLALFILALFFYTDWLSALFVMVYFILVLIIFQIVTQKRVAQTGKNFTVGSVSVAQSISDVLTGFKEISVHSRIPYFLERIIEARTSVARASAVQTYMQQVPRLIVELALIVGAIGFASFQFASTAGSPDLGVVSIFIIGSLRLMSALLPLYRAFMQLRYDRPQALSSQTLVREARGPNSPARGASIAGQTKKSPPLMEASGGLSVVLRDVEFGFPDHASKEKVIHRVSLSIEAGSSVAFIGPSGSGKSTLVNLILGLYEPTSGEVLCSGLKPTLLRESFPGFVSYVPQKPGLISGTLRDNIALGVPEDEVDEIALWESIQLAQIEDLLNVLPDGIHSNVGEQLDNMSGGQVQRIGLARALYTRPKLLVLDEATSALDAETEASVSEALYKLGVETTRVLVAHRLSSVQNADNVFLLVGGQLVASGSLQDLEREEPLVRKYISLMSFE